MTYLAKVRTKRKRRGWFGFGDVPVTNPHQVDPTLEIEMPDDYVGSGTPPSSFDPNSSEVVATVGPIITGVDKVTQAWNDFVNKWSPQPAVTTTITPSGPQTAAPAAAVSMGTSNVLLVAGALAAGYYLFGRKKRKA